MIPFAYDIRNFFAERPSQEAAMATGGGPESLSMDAVAVPEAGSVLGQVGYPTSIFNKSVDPEKYSCAYCKKILREPVQSRDCGHRFCHACQKAIEK
jgi:hypothetical protein